MLVKLRISVFISIVFNDLVVDELYYLDIVGLRIVIENGDYIGMI